jgi:protein ImuB
LAKLEETELIARLGQAGKELRLLARGESPHLFTAIESGLTLEERMELDSPLELLDSLLFVMGVMLDQLIVRAQTRILALASITLLWISKAAHPIPARCGRHCRITIESYG